MGWAVDWRNRTRGQEERQLWCWCCWLKDVVSLQINTEIGKSWIGWLGSSSIRTERTPVPVQLYSCAGHSSFKLNDFVGFHFYRSFVHVSFVRSSFVHIMITIKNKQLFIRTANSTGPRSKDERKMNETVQVYVRERTSRKHVHRSWTILTVFISAFHDETNERKNPFLVVHRSSSFMFGRTNVRSSELWNWCELDFDGANEHIGLFVLAWKIFRDKICFNSFVISINATSS